MNKPTPKIYRTTNWSTYNNALVNRGNISIWFDPVTQQNNNKDQHKDAGTTGVIPYSS